MQGVGRLGLGASLEAASNCKQNSCLSFQKRLTVDMPKKKQNNAMILWAAFARHDAANSAMSSHDVDHCDHTDCRVFPVEKSQTQNSSLSRPFSSFLSLFLPPPLPPSPSLHFFSLSLPFPFSPRPFLSPFPLPSSPQIQPHLGSAVSYPSLQWSPGRSIALL